MGRQKLWLDENRGWCKSTLPLCHSNPDPFSKRMLSRLFGLYARPPGVSITFLLTLPPAYFSADSPRIETKNTRLLLFFFLLEEEEAATQSSIECWNCCSRFRSSLFFDKISLLVRRDEKNLSIFPPSFFFFSFPDKFQFLLSETSVLRYCE